ncbi:unnamed protein product [Parnassius apollo]|uniref:(apollo) hypothetical protein n=1 Tax=Parnassius apollo TaxID=110799 RepID=A0A8S3Y3X3_PARAO|nr:unnamed protein product [Parnassius apollo]
MTDRHVFTSKNNYARLEEILESRVADENDDVQYDVFLLPPDPAIVIDEEEEGNEDDLSSFPRDVPGTVEVAPLHPDHDISD